VGERLDPPEEVAGLAVAARRYAANLLGAAADFYPGAVAGVRTFFGLVGRAETPDEDVPGAAAWAWARLLAGWSDWRSHRLERRLLLPPPDDLARLAVRCRETADVPEPTTGRLWSLFARPSQPAAPVEPRELLAKYAELLDAMAAPATPAARAALDRAVDLGRAIDDRIASLPRDWVPVRIARVAGLIPEWSPDPPEDTPPGFLPWLGYLLRFTLDRGPHTTTPELFSLVLREALDDLREARHVPPDGEAFVALDAFRRLELPVPELAWFRVLAALLELAGTADTQSNWPRRLARLAAHAVTQVIPNAEPPIDPDLLSVPCNWVRPGRLDVRYVVHPAEPRTVVRVDRFAIPPEKAAITVSLGPRPPGTTIWLTAGGADRLVGLPDGDGTKLVTRSRKRAEAEFWSVPPDRDGLSALRKAWADWLATEAGREWFHAIASRAATGDDAPEARAWLVAITDTAEASCFPVIDPRTGRATWPADLPFTQGGVSFVVDEAPAGSVVAVERFAHQPAAARFRVSLGRADGATAAVAKAWDAVAAGGLELDEFRALLAPGLDAAMRSGEPVPPDVLARLLDRLGALDPPEPDGIASRDTLLSALRDWAAADELTIHPDGWTFADGGLAPAPDTAGVAVKAVFRRDVPAGRVAKVKAFGLTGPDGPLRTGEVVVSAGPPPHGLTELEAAAESVPGPTGEELREAFRGLRPAGAGGYLELAGVDLFTRFWDHVRPVWTNTNPAAAETFAEGLRVMLREAFGLETFAPLNYRDHPTGWVNVPPGTRMSSGRVTRVIRPGLASGDVLRVPARVEAE
jgi:hypothetical protein